jgi:hypothetical protein
VVRASFDFASSLWFHSVTRMQSIMIGFDFRRTMHMSIAARLIGSGELFAFR